MKPKLFNLPDKKFEQDQETKQSFINESMVHLTSSHSHKVGAVNSFISFINKSAEPLYKKKDIFWPRGFEALNQEKKESVKEVILPPNQYEEHKAYAVYHCLMTDIRELNVTEFKRVVSEIKKELKIMDSDSILLDSYAKLFEFISFLKDGIIINPADVFDRAVDLQQYACVKYLLEDERMSKFLRLPALQKINCYPLHDMAIRGNLAITKLLVQHLRPGVFCKSNPNYFYPNIGGTPLHFSAQYGNVSLFEYWLEQGIDHDCQDGSGNTAVQLLNEELGYKGTSKNKELILKLLEPQPSLCLLM